MDSHDPMSLHPLQTHQVHQSLQPPHLQVSQQEVPQQVPQQQQQQQQQQQVPQQQQQQQTPQQQQQQQQQHTPETPLDMSQIVAIADDLFPHLAFGTRGNQIKKLEHFILTSFSRNPDPVYNLIFLQRNCGDSANVYIQHFLLELLGQYITQENCIFTIPSSKNANPARLQAGASPDGTISKPFTFYTNIFPELMIRFLTKRPELVGIICPNSGQTILHQYNLHFSVLKFVFHTNPALICVRDNQGRLPLHHKNLPQYIVASALRQYPELAIVTDAKGRSVQEVLGLGPQ